MSRPVITHINEQVMQQLYPWHPFLLTNTEEGIADYLLNLYSNLEQRQRIGAKGRLWVEMFHDQPTASKIYAQRIQEVIVRMQSTHLL